MKVVTFKDHIFVQKFILTYGNMDEIKMWLSDRKIELDHNTDWQAFSGTLPTGEHLLHFDYYGFTAIVHETHHASLDVLNNRGLNCNQSTKEVFAYYQDWLAGKCRDYLEKWTKSERNLMTKNTQGSEWEKRFDQTFSSDDLHVSGRKKWADFIDQEITASNKDLLQKVKEIVNKRLRLPVDDVAELKDELLEKLAKLEGEI